LLCSHFMQAGKISADAAREEERCSGCQYAACRHARDEGRVMVVFGHGIEGEEHKTADAEHEEGQSRDDHRAQVQQSASPFPTWILPYWLIPADPQVPAASCLFLCAGNIKSFRIRSRSTSDLAFIIERGKRFCKIPAVEHSRIAVESCAYPGFPALRRCQPLDFCTRG